MFDIALHIRFLQKATEAFFEMSQASVAAAMACQSRLHDNVTSGDRQTATTPLFWPTWFGDWTPGTAPMTIRPNDPFEAGRAAVANLLPFGHWSPPAVSPGAAFDPMQTWLVAASAWQDLAQRGALAACGAGLSAWPNSATRSSLERNSLEYLPGADDGDDAVLRRPLFGGRSDGTRQHVSDGRRGCRVHAMAAGFR